MAGKEIYPKSVFENQTNGTVFYREGKLNDPMMPNQAGVFESWRYSFDSGRQVFKANGTDKVYEKRLIKDRLGNPHWSEWMEISPGEAHGIQAIAINDRPLLLPNEDGAIKLQITPQMIDTYTKREIYDLVTQKINDTYSEAYEYVNWADGCYTAKEVLDKTYPDGGEEGKFYLVEPKPEEGVVHNATYWVYQLTNATTAHEGYQFVEVATPPNLKSFVSYSAFVEHTNDDLIHITDLERQEWNKNIAANKKDIEEHSMKISELTDKIYQHINDAGELTSPHLSSEERMRLNSVFQNVKQMPNNTNRYVVENGQYSLAYEQDGLAAATETKTIKEIGSSSFKHGDYLILHDDNFRTQLNLITSDNNLIERVYVELNGISVFGDYSWRIEADNGFTSNWMNSATTWKTFDIPINQIPETVYVKTSDPNATVSIGDVKFLCAYRKRLAANIGDSTKRLRLNLVGPSDSLPTYNGRPLNELTSDSSNTARWGHIVGDIAAQTDISKKIADAISKKINYADIDSHLRWDVYRDGVIKSIIQQTDALEETVVEIKGTNGPRKDGSVLISDIQKRVRALKDAGWVVYSSKLVIDNVSVFQDADHEPIPVYFTTDNEAIPQSQQVIGPFVWDWPGSLFNDFNSIFVNGGAEYITNARLVVKAVKYGDIEIGLLNETKNEYYNITLKADEFANEVNDFIVRAKASIKLEADESFDIAAKKDVNVVAGENIDVKAGKKIDIGDKADYGAEKDSVILIYGQEADDRYASRVNLESEVKTRQEEDEKYAKVAADATAALKGEFEQITDNLKDEFDDLSEKVDESIESNEAAIKAIDEKVDGAISDLDAEIDERKKADDSLIAILDTQKEAITTLQETMATKSDIERATANEAESFDLVINDAAELLAAIKDGTFEAAGRILFKKGTYALSAAELSDKHINFSEISYIKGEIPCSVDLSEGLLPVADSYDHTTFDGINIDVGSGLDALSIVDGDERVKKYTAKGDTMIELLPAYDRFEVELEGPASLTFTGVTTRRYEIDIDQPLDAVHPVTVTNVSSNNSVEFTQGLEHQQAGMRTVIIARGDDEFTEDALVVEQVAYGVANGYLVGRYVDVKMVGVKQRLYASDFEDVAVVAEDTVAEIGGTLVLKPIIKDGWAHNDRGSDYIVRGSDGTLLGEGQCDKETTFKVPDTFKADHIEVEFHVKPQLALIAMESIYDPYVANTKTGFVKYQTHYQEAEIWFEMNEGYSLYALHHDQLTVDWQGTLPYKFTPKATADRLDYTLYIRPRFYRAFDDFTLKVVEPGDFDKERSFYVGHTSDFTIEPHFIVPADANYGFLYTAAPITFIGGARKGEDFASDITGSVFYEDDKETLQRAEIFVPEDYANSYVDLSFAIAGPKDTHVVKTLFATVEGASGEVEGDRVMNRYANDDEATFEFSHISKNAEDYPGVWTTSDARIAIVVDATDNGPEQKCKVQVKKNGHVTLFFKTNNFRNTTRVEIEGRIHAYQTQCGNITTTIDTANIVPPVYHLGIDGKAVPASTIYDTTGAYIAQDGAEYIDDSSETSISIFNKPLPEGESFVKESFTYKSNSEFTQKQEALPGVATITGKKYRFNIDWAQSLGIESLTLYTSNGVSANGNAFILGDSTIGIIIKLIDGKEFKKSDVFAEKLENFEITDARPGYFSAKAVMPRAPVSISL